MTEHKPLTGASIVNTIAAVGPLDYPDLTAALKSQGIDTGGPKLLNMLGALRSSGRIVKHENLYAYNYVAILRLDDRQTATLHLLYEAIDGLCVNVSELVSQLCDQ